MKIGKLSLAFAFVLLVGAVASPSARAQDHDPGIVPKSAGGSPVPASATKPAVVDLGELDKPGTQIVAAAAKVGHALNGTIELFPGQTLKFQTRQNQIWGIEDLKASPAKMVKITSTELAPMKPGVLGSTSLWEYSITLSGKATNKTAVKLQATGQWQARKSADWTFELDIQGTNPIQPIGPAKAHEAEDDGLPTPSKGKAGAGDDKTADQDKSAAKTEQAAAPKTEAAQDGVTDAIRNRGRASDAEAPRTGLDRVIEDKIDDGKHPERAAGEK